MCSHMVYFYSSLFLSRQVLNEDVFVWGVEPTDMLMTVDIISGGTWMLAPRRVFNFNTRSHRELQLFHTGNWSLLPTGDWSFYSPQETGALGPQGIGAFPSEMRRTAPIPYGRGVFKLNARPQFQKGRGCLD